VIAILATLFVVVASFALYLFVRARKADELERTVDRRQQPIKQNEKSNLNGQYVEIQLASMAQHDGNRFSVSLAGVFLHFFLSFFLSFFFFFLKFRIVELCIIDAYFERIAKLCRFFV
jgi:predicted PurR-regulated permease PerM